MRLLRSYLARSFGVALFSGFSETIEIIDGNHRNK